MLREQSLEVQQIKQAYVAFSKGMTCRIRHIWKRNKSKWYFTFKQKIGDRVVEIEKKINKRDGQDIWDICVGKLKKTRYILNNNDIIWEIDFFYKGTMLYFIQAEVELEEGFPRPKEVHPILKDFVIYNVPLQSDKFSNKRLGDVDYAKKLYEKISKGTQNE